jgi:AraC-like DNA-binding protein
MAPTGAAALRVSTGAMPARRRAAEWREDFARGFLRLEVESDDPEHFEAEASIRMLPDFKAAFFRSSASLWRRTRRVIEPGDDELGIVLRRQGSAVLSQGRHSFELGPGDAATCLHSEPADLALAGDMGRHVGLIVPLKPLAALLRDDGVTPRRIAGSNEALRLLIGYLGVIEQDATLTSPKLCRTVVTHLHDLIALAIGATRDGAELASGRGLRAARLRVVKTDVLANLGSRDLSVAAVARRQGITPRYVHMLFETEGTTFSQFVLGERLELARRLLADVRHDSRKIATIAYEAGFGDLSYFNRSFRRRFGATPREARAQLAGGTRATSRDA